jgi:integrase
MRVYDYNDVIDRGVATANTIIDNNNNNKTVKLAGNPQLLASVSTTLTDSFSNVRVFLNSIERNSRTSMGAYKTGLAHFQLFLLNSKYQSDQHQQPEYYYNIETIIQAFTSNELNVYTILDAFVNYLTITHLTTSSITLYVTSVRSYLAYYDIDIFPSKFKRKVKMPKLQIEDEIPLDASDIRKLLLACSNRRLKTYLLVLASGGMRATEALAIRLKDLDFTVEPTKIHIRKEFSKTKTARDIYISQEASQHLTEWLNWKYSTKKKISEGETLTKGQDDLIFSTYNTNDPLNLCTLIASEFTKLLSKDSVRLDERKDEGRQKRHRVTLHSFRWYVKTTISNASNQDYSEWFLGHEKSSYYTIKESERRRIYVSLMPYLTFLDYDRLEFSHSSIKDQLKYKDDEITVLKRQVSSLKNSFDTYINDLPGILDKLIEGRDSINLNIPQEVILSMENETDERHTEISNNWLTSISSSSSTSTRKRSSK